MAYNNTYGIQLLNQSLYEASLHDYNRPGGCKDLTLYCRELVSKSDPHEIGDIEKVNRACIEADRCSGQALTGRYLNFTDVSANITPSPVPYSISLLHRAVGSTSHINAMTPFLHPSTRDTLINTGSKRPSASP